MRTVSFTDFRRNASTYFDDVERGEKIRVERHGRAVAELVPVSDAPEVPSWKRPGPRLRIEGASLSRAILEEREEGQ